MNRLPLQQFGLSPPEDPEITVEKIPQVALLRSGKSLRIKVARKPWPLSSQTEGHS